MEHIKEPRDDNGKFQDKFLFQVMKRRVGQPKKWKTPEELAFKAFEFFNWCSETKNKVTFAGCRLFLGMSRENWSAYKHDYPEYSDTIKHIEQMLESEWEQKLGWAGSTQGAIFWLKNKAGWKDEIIQQQHQHVTQVNPQVVNPSDTPPLASNEGDIKD